MKILGYVIFYIILGDLNIYVEDPFASATDFLVSSSNHYVLFTASASYLMGTACSWLLLLLIANIPLFWGGAGIGVLSATHALLFFLFAF